MARRRMFSLDVIDTDLFMDMPHSTQSLYFHLAMRADDDGFVAAPKKIMKMCNCSDYDIKILFAKKYIFAFENGVCVIMHWKVHNYIQSDRYKETVYHDEREEIIVQENNIYRIDKPCIQNGYNTDTQVRLGKDRIGKVSKGNNSIFKKPTIEQVKEYCTERSNGIDAERFIDYYESNGWHVGRNKMKDWKAAIRTWERNNKDRRKDLTEDERLAMGII